MVSDVPSEQQDDGQGGTGDAAAPASRGRQKQTLRERALGALTFFYGSADHRNLPDDERRATGTSGEDVGDGYRRHGEPGHEYVTRDDDPQR